MNLIPVVHVFLALTLAPLLFGIINKTKAFFAGRQGPPVMQPYYDIEKLLRKGAVYSFTTTWIFQAGPIVGLAATAVATAMVPFGDSSALIAFPGDLIAFAYLLGLTRFMAVLAALDTGSSFEGMGASREVQFSALAEPALLLGLAALSMKTGSSSLSGIFSNLSFETWRQAGPPLALVVVAFLIVVLAENARIPIDDPNTHLELTMIHEVMVLDHSGPLLAFIQYSAALKFWILGTFLVNFCLPLKAGNPWLGEFMALLGMAGLAVLVGIVESVMARLRLVRVPQLLTGASVLSTLAFILLRR